MFCFFFFFSSRRRHTRFSRDWSSDVCSSDLGARGQGATEDKLFVREGSKVVFGDILDEEGQRVEAEIRAAGGEAIYVHLDVTNEDSWRAAVDTAVRLYGTLNILVNNAGIYIRKRIEETTEDDLDQILAVNVKGVFLGTHHTISPLRRDGGGSIND